ncbi:hypothetical protein SAMD00079811_28230 [Scytonema sp. HK-05]|nr:hypothetical protein SAMD00079811_28230 [Scytonema sp. HK-05]
MLAAHYLQLPQHRMSLNCTFLTLMDWLPVPVLASQAVQWVESGDQ